MRATATAVVAASPDRVWELLADHEGMSSWGPGITVTLDREGDDDRNGVGAVRRIDAPGPAPTIVEVVDRFEPGVALGYHATGGVPLKNYRGDVTLAPAAGGTRVEWTITADRRVPVVEQIVIKGIATGLLKALVRQVRKK